MRKSYSVVVLVALALSATSALAVTYLVPPDAELVAAAPAIVVARAVVSYPQLAQSGGAVTVTELVVDDVLKGDVAAGTTIHVTDPGGIVGNFATVIPGSPRYENGAQYLIFLGRNQFGDWGTYAMGLGKFRFVQDLTGRDFVLRGEEGAIEGVSKTDWTPHAEKLRSASEFLSFIRAVVNGGAAAARADYLVDRRDVVLAGFTHPIAPNFRAIDQAARTDYLSQGNLRWKTPTATIYYCCASKSYQGPSSTLNAVSAFTTALGRWDGAGAGVNYINGGNNENATGGLTGYGRSFHDGKNAVLFGDPFGDLPNPGGNSFLLGIGGGNGWSYTGPDSLTYFGPDVAGGSPAGEVDVIINDSIDPVGQVRFNAAVTHELGHTLGFRHSDKTPDDNSACAAPLPCTSTAIMNSFVNQDYLGLQQWDRDAINTVYGTGQSCTPAAISTQPANQTITSGQQASLTVGATGTAPLAYQWYVGTPSNTATPATDPGNTAATFTPSPSTTTTYWVRVSNSCNNAADSNAVTVTVNSNQCTPPSIATQPSNVTITQGQQTSLSVTVNGTAPFTYQWYIGNPPDTSTLVGTASTLTVSPSSTTSYWVQVSNACRTVNSNAATVTVNPPACVAPSITSDPPDQTVTTGTSASLFVGYTGTTGTVTWYQGTKPDRSHSVGTGQTLQTPPLSSPAQFWAEVTNSCSSAQTRTVTVSVTAACVAPAITLVDAAPRTATVGQTVTLTVQATGSSLQYQWYRGARGDFSSPVAGATTATATDTPTLSTSYFVRVSNTCGTQLSDAIAVTVSASCVAPAIVAADVQPRTINAGQTVTLTVQATGTGLSYQWYRGAQGDTSNPVANGAAASATDTPSANTSYWVQVTNACGNAASTPIAVVVNATNCVAPTIVSVSPNATVSTDSSATLSVSAAGDALHYQWYRGAVDDTTTPLGSDDPTLTTPLLFADAQFWVKVTNTCGIAKSRAIVVTVVPGRHRAARH